MLRLYRDPDEKVKSYLDICQEPIPEPVLDVVRTEDIFRCMNFIVLGIYNTKKLNETQQNIEKQITENGGTVLKETDIRNRSKLSFLNHHYCVLPSRSSFDSFIRGTVPRKAFYHTTLGNWTYINVQFILVCLKKKSLVDPQKYVFEIDDSQRSKFRRIRHQSIAPQLQRQSQPSTFATIMYHTAMRKYKTESKKTLKRKLSNVD